MAAAGSPPSLTIPGYGIQMYGLEDAKNAEW